MPNYRHNWLQLFCGSLLYAFAKSSIVDGDLENIKIIWLYISRGSIKDFNGLSIKHNPNEEHVVVLQYQLPTNEQSTK